MGEQSKIQWTDATVNFWTGCIKVSDGCKFCYMYRDKERYGQDPRKVVRTRPHTFNAALKWPEPKKIFTNSWSDFFIEEADAWREDAWNIIRRTPQHQWQILTKRPERIVACLPNDWGEGYPNVWLGVSVENDENRWRIGMLRKIPAKIRFISVEPILNPFRLKDRLEGIHWVIIGGESGNDQGKYRYRPSQVFWYSDLVRDCLQAEVAVFVKQLGTHLAKELSLDDRHGGNIEEWPEVLQIRQFPPEGQPAC